MHGEPMDQSSRAKPFVLPEDLKSVEDINGNLRVESDFALRIEKILPEAFVASADAPVLLLSNNPGLHAFERWKAVLQQALP